jgi:D-threo-aldose 1-dehydrogenase
MRALSRLIQLGTTGVHVAPLGFGGAEIGNLYEAVPELRAQETLQRAYDAGMRLFDTSPFYGFGLSELRLGQFLRTQPRDSFAVATKVGRVLVAPRHSAAGPEPWAAPLPFRPVFDYSYAGTMRSLEQSTMRLGLPRIDIALVHDADRRNHGAAFETRFGEVMTGAYRALEEARHAGDVGAIGVAVSDADVAARFLAEGDFDCVLLASRYTLLEQDAIDTFFDRPETRGVPVLLAGVFNSGILAAQDPARWTYDYASASPAILERRRRLAEIAEMFHVPLAAAALQFASAPPSVVSAIIGMARPERVEATVAALTTVIPAEFWTALKATGLVRADAPVPQSRVAPDVADAYP